MFSIGNENKTDVVCLLHKGGEAYGRNTIIITNNKITFCWFSINNYHYVCLNYSYSCNYKQAKIVNKKTHLS